MRSFSPGAIAVGPLIFVVSGSGYIRLRAP
jgi:hypothetical protein